MHTRPQLTLCQFYWIIMSKQSNMKYDFYRIDRNEKFGQKMGIDEFDCFDLGFDNSWVWTLEIAWKSLMLKEEKNSNLRLPFLCILKIVCFLSNNPYQQVSRTFPMEADEGNIPDYLVMVFRKIWVWDNQGSRDNHLL